MHDAQHYQVVGKLRDYRRMIHSQSEVRPSKKFNCISAYVCICKCMCMLYMYVFVYTCMYTYLCIYVCTRYVCTYIIMYVHVYILCTYIIYLHDHVVYMNVHVQVF